MTFELGIKCAITVVACCGADFGERSCPRGLNGDARIRGWRPTNPALKYALCYKPFFSFFNLIADFIRGRNVKF